MKEGLETAAPMDATPLLEHLIATLSVLESEIVLLQERAATIRLDIARLRAETAELRGDRLVLIRGLDETAAGMLAGLGITAFKDIAALTEEDVRELGSMLGDARRISRQGWIEQAALLARGTLTDYAARMQAGESHDLVSSPRAEAAIEIADVAAPEASIASGADTPTKTAGIIEQLAELPAAETVQIVEIVETSLAPVPAVAEAETLTVATPVAEAAIDDVITEDVAAAETAAATEALPEAVPAVEAEVEASGEIEVPTALPTEEPAQAVEAPAASVGIVDIKAARARREGAGRKRAARAGTWAALTASVLIVLGVALGGTGVSDALLDQIGLKPACAASATDAPCGQLAEAAY